ncbi:carbohydrate porin [Burkholderia multivorans]|nr:carbohydrate porin [Burkholderia multivorans]
MGKGTNGDSLSMAAADGADLRGSTLSAYAPINLAPYNSEGVPNVTRPRPEGKTGPLATLGDTLNEYGINYQGFFLMAGFSNLSTGVRPGHFGGQGVFVNNVDLDIGKMAPVKGAKIHVEIVVFPFTYPTDSNVNLGTWASSYLGSDQYPPHSTGAPWLSLLTWEQTLLNGRLNFEVGKTNLLRYFFGPNCGLDFMCTDSLVKYSSGLPDNSVGSMGGRVRYNISDNVWIEGGVQQLRDYSAYLDKNGWDFTAINRSQGTFLVGGAGYHSDFSSSAYPSDYRLDYYYANTQISDPYMSVNGRSSVLTGEPAATHRGSDGVIFKMQQTIWSEGAPSNAPAKATPRSIAVFSSIERAFDSAKPIGWGLQAGLILNRPFPSLKIFSVDQITLTALYDRLNRSTLLAQRDLRVLHGGSSQTTSPNEYRFSLSTTLGFGRFLKLQPVIEYILNPDTSMSTSSPRLPRSGWVAGVNAVVTFGNTHL